MVISDWCVCSTLPVPSRAEYMLFGQMLGTHGGKLHVLDLSGQHIKSFAAHTASVLDISLDVAGDWIATASIDGEWPTMVYITNNLSWFPSLCCT